jgi:hypothetical protein
MGADRGNEGGNGIQSVREVFQRGANGDLVLRAGGSGLLGWYC